MMDDFEDMSNMTDAQREAHWKAKEDAKTLAESEIIKNDPERLKAATDMAAKLADKKVEEARSMSKVANTLFDKTSPKE